MRRVSENFFVILANKWRIFFTTINLEPKYVKDVILAALILHNMLIKSSNSVNVYRITSSLHNKTLYAKSVRENFMDYFVNDGVVERQWKYSCKFLFQTVSKGSYTM